MMRDSLKRAAQDPLFQPTLNAGVENLVVAAHLLSMVGIDITLDVNAIIEKIKQELLDATYELTDVDELISQAQSIGDEVVKEKKTSTGDETTPNT